MKLSRLISGIGLVIILLAVTLSARASALDIPSLEIVQLKVTSGNGQFIVLYNQSSTTLDLNKFELDYTSSSGKLNGLPITGTLGPNDYYFINDDQILACYQMTISNTTLGMTVGTGSGLKLWETSADGLTKTLQDSVSWTNKSSDAGVGASPWLLPTDSGKTHFLARRPLDSSNNPVTATAGSGTWAEVYFNPSNPCAIEETSAAVVSTPTTYSLLPPSPPPAKIIALTTNSSSMTGIPASDSGLRSPVVNELLPNPAPPQTDVAGEFIELYNPNPANFDLRGFVLQTGISTTHKYTFPSGVILKPSSFTAFSLTGTGLSLSNTSGRVELLDPLGGVVSKSSDYGSAKDGQAWALADGSWYWTTTPTPSAENVIYQTSSGSNSSGQPRVLGASTASPASSGGSSSSSSATTAKASLHPWTLAGVGALALLYAGYEYRSDLANNLHRLRRYRAARAAARPKPKGWGSTGAAGRLGRWQNHVRTRAGQWLKKR